MSDKSPKPQEPDTDVHDDPDEPAFEWMKPASSGATSAAGNSAPADAATKAQPASSAPTGSQPESRTGSQPAAPTGTQPESRAGRKAAEAAETEPEPPLFAGSSPAGKPTGGASHSEPLPTSALQVRPPEEEVARRNAEREQAAKVKPLAPRIFQVLLAIFFPIILLVLAVRAVASPLFLWIEYNRPGFPGTATGSAPKTA